MGQAKLTSQQRCATPLSLPLWRHFAQICKYARKKGSARILIRLFHFARAAGGRRSLHCGTRRAGEFAGRFLRPGCLGWAAMVLRYACFSGLIDVLARRAHLLPLGGCYDAVGKVAPLEVIDDALDTVPKRSDFLRVLPKKTQIRSRLKDWIFGLNGPLRRFKGERNREAA